MASPCHLLSLPQEIRDQIISYIFQETPYDTLDTRRAELRIFDNHAILHRSFVVPPPSWKGCSKFFRTCKQLHHEGMAFLYPKMLFLVTIDGRLKEMPQRRSRLHSEYPLGPLQSCTMLRYMKSVSLTLVASTGDDMLTLGTRLKAFLVAVSDNPRIDISDIKLYLDGPQPLNRGHADQIANMIKEIETPGLPTVYLGSKGTLSRSCWKGFNIISGTTDAPVKQYRPEIRHF